MKHEVEYKMTVDALRIACANVESDLALDLAPRLYRPRDAKRVLANVLAVRGWLADLNTRKLVLPADPCAASSGFDRHDR